MDIFGLTPIDAALSAFGLNCSYKLTQFLFIQTPIGVLAFTTAFFLSLYQGIREGSYKGFVILLLMTLVGIFLLILPSIQEPAIKSAVELHHTPSISSKALKDSQTNEHSMPTVLSFFGQMADVTALGVISVLDRVFSSNMTFLDGPFGVQKLSLQANQSLHAPLSDISLKDSLEGFIYAQYLPSLMMYKDANSQAEGLWPGDERITAYYSVSQKTQWEALRTNLKALIDNSEGNWSKIKTLPIFSQDQRMDDQIMASIIRGQLPVGEKHWLWTVSSSIITLFPYITGWTNFCLYAAFPIFMLSLLIIRKLSLLLGYAQVFLWVKSLNLCAAFSFYISLFAARMQGQLSAGQNNWFWDYPYYATIAAFLLCVMPVLTWFGIYQMFRTKF